MLVATRNDFKYRLSLWECVSGKTEVLEMILVRISDVLFGREFSCRIAFPVTGVDDAH
jgi:hypothetical protein